MKSPLPPVSVLERVAKEAWPGPPLRRFSVDNSGWTNLMLDADDRILFRFPRWVEAAKSLGVEVRLLDFLSRHLTAPIPRPILIGTMDRPPGWPFFAYEKLPGKPLVNLSTLRRGERERLAEFLVRLLAELSACPTGALRGIGLRSGDRASWAERFVRLEQRYRRVAARRLSPALHRRIAWLFEDFYATLSASRYRPTLLHGDLWPSHILWNTESGTPTGVIDWEDARLGDPAFDLTTFGEIGREGSRTLLRSRKSVRDELFEARLVFYRRILPLQGLLFGLETRRAALVRDHLVLLRKSVEYASRG